MTVRFHPVKKVGPGEVQEKPTHERRLWWMWKRGIVRNELPDAFNDVTFPNLYARTKIQSMKELKTLRFNFLASLEYRAISSRGNGTITNLRGAKENGSHPGGRKKTHRPIGRRPPASQAKRNINKKPQGRGGSKQKPFHFLFRSTSKERSRV